MSGTMAWWRRLAIWYRLVASIVFWGLVLIALPLLYRAAACPDLKTTWHIQGYEMPAKQNQSNQPYYIATEKHHRIGDQKVQPGKPDEDVSPSLVCSEVKFGDVAITFFTLCLVVLGWFTLKSADENTKRAQRGYLIAGPLFGAPKSGVDEWERTHRARSSMFKGPWRLSLQNFGKTAVHTTKVEWGLCPEQHFPRDVLVSTLITSSEHIEWRSRYMREPVIIQDVFTPTDTVPYQYRHVLVEDRDKYVGYVLFGKITYKDVFREEHYSTFSYLMREDHSDSIGVSLSDDHT